MIHAYSLTDVSSSVSRVGNAATDKLLGVVFVAVLTATLASSAAAQANKVQEPATTASFQGLGQMPGADRGAGTYANNISADGSTIVGWAWVCPNGQPTCGDTDKTEAFGWTVKGKYRRLGGLGTRYGSMANAASADGSVIVGDVATSPNGGAFRWTAAHGMVPLPTSMLFGDGVTPDGNMVVGGDHWWKITGKVGKFGPFRGYQDLTQASAVTGTMAAPIAVGSAAKGFNADAFRWTPATGMQDIGSFGGAVTAAIAISEDGSVIVGVSQVQDGTFNLFHAFRWTAATGMQDLGTLGGVQSAAYGVNHDGSVIVGYSDTTSSSGSADAFIWTATTGMQSLKAVLQAHGVHTADKWVLVTAAVGISADGTIIAGSGRSPRTKEFPFGVDTPFRVVLPVP